MNKAIIAVLLLCIIGSSTATDVFKCVKDGLAIVKDLKSFVDSAKSKSTKDIVIGAYTVLGELSPLVKDCGITLPIDIPEINAADLEGCATNTDGLLGTVKQLTEDISGRKLINIVGDATLAVTQIKEIVNDCKNNKSLQSSLNPLACLQSAQKFYKESQALIDGVKSKDVPEIVNDSYIVIESLQPTLNDCGLDINLHIPTITFPDLKGCVVDAESLVDTIKKIRDDFSSHQFAAVFDDVSTVVKTLQTIAQICKPSKPQLSSSNVFECISKVKQAVKDVQDFIEVNKEKKPINEVIVHAYTVIEEIQPVFNTCGIKVDLHIPNIEFADLNGCVVDGQDIVENFKNLLTSLKQKEFLKIIEEAKTIVASTQNAVAACKASKKPVLQSSLNIKCIQKIGKIGKDVYEVYKKLSGSSNIVEEITTIESFLQDLQPVCDACGIHVHIPTIPADAKITATAQCVADVAKVVVDIGNIYTNVSSLNIVSAFNNIKDFISSGSDAITVCRQI